MFHFLNQLFRKPAAHTPEIYPHFKDKGSEAERLEYPVNEVTQLLMADPGMKLKSSPFFSFIYKT